MAKKFSREWFRAQGQKGGKKAWAALSPEERTRINRERAKKAWQTKRAKKK